VSAGARPAIGAPLPAFALPNARGVYVDSQDLIAKGPLVLSFNRGGWCPYCRTELSAWAEAMPELHKLGGTFVSVTPEVGGRAEAMRPSLGLDAEVLCDVDHGLALELGLAFHLGGELRQRYLACGLDLGEAYGSPSWFIPVPATFVIDREAASSASPLSIRISGSAPNPPTSLPRSPSSLGHTRPATVPRSRPARRG
jgi:peroxiredoxin